MNFSRQQVFRTISIVAISIVTSSCTQDQMIRVNSTSNLKLIPSTEIRYKACGESADSCQEIFQIVTNKKSELAAIARVKFEAERSRQLRVAVADKEKKSRECRTTTVNRNTPRTYQRVSTNIAIPMATQEEIAAMQQCENFNNRMVVSDTRTGNFGEFGKANKNDLNPTEEDTKKIIKAVSETNLNEYTFSKSDGSIVVICPTRFCAISSADGGWIGIGERGKPNTLSSLVQ